MLGSWFDADPSLRVTFESPSLETFKKTCRCGTLGYDLAGVVVLG